MCLGVNMLNNEDDLYNGKDRIGERISSKHIRI